VAQDTFDWLAARLAAGTALSDLEARGTLRLALKSAGLDAKSANADAYRVVVERVLARELATRGVADADAVCAQLAGELASLESSQATSRNAASPEAVFARLGGR
jgi:hypothetical protein